MRLRSLSVSNFKSIAVMPERVVLAPLTVLVGPNGAGKSSILESLALLAQQTRAGKSGFQWDGSYVRLGGFAETRHANGEGGIRFHLEFETSKDDIPVPSSDWDDSAETERGSGLLVDGKTLLVHVMKAVESISRSTTFRVFVDIDPDGRSLSFALGSRQETYMVVRGDSSIRQVSFNLDGVDVACATYGGTEGSPAAGPPPELLDHHRLRPFRVSGSSPPGARQESQGFLPSTMDPLLRILASLVESIRGCLKRVFYLSAPRGGMATTAPPGPAVDWVGTTPNEFAGFMANLWKDRQHRTARGSIVKWAMEFGVNELEAGWQSERGLVLDYVDPFLDATLGVQSLGFGSRQILPILVQGFASPAGSVLLVEEPEISIHPDGQLKLLDMLGEVIAGGRQVVLTTHSPTMLLGMGRLVHNARLATSDVNAYHVDRSKKMRATTLRRLEMGPDGYLTGWEESFARAERELMRDWLESQPERRDGGRGGS